MKATKLPPILWQFLNIVALVAVVVMNSLATALPLNGRATGEISDALPSFFTPAGYTFSIWGLIYSGLIAFIVFQALPSSRQRWFLNRIGPWFVVSSVANVGWIVAWHYGFYGLSLLLMSSLLLTLIIIYVRLNIGRPDPALSLTDKLFVQGPFSLYIGWITVATIANYASVLNYWGWNGWGIAEPTWAAIMIAVAVVVAGLVLINRRNLAYAGVLIWALFGIRAAQTAEPLVATTAVVAAVLIFALALVGYWRTRQPAGYDTTSSRISSIQATS